jgi:hypothetical protein
VKKSLNVKLLRKVQKHIMKEPKRLLMGEWLVTKSKKVPQFENDAGEWEHFPKCNTAACIAGWAVMLHDKHPPRGKSIETRATKILGGSSMDSLFYTSLWKLEHEFNTAETPRQRAKIAVKEIDHFIKEHEKKKRSLGK